MLTTVTVVWLNTRCDCYCFLDLSVCHGFVCIKHWSSYECDEGFRIGYSLLLPNFIDLFSLAHLTESKAPGHVTIMHHPVPTV